MNITISAVTGFSWCYSYDPGSPGRAVIPVISGSSYSKLIEGDTVLTEKLLEYVAPPACTLHHKKGR